MSLEDRVTALEITMSGVLVTQSGQTVQIAALQSGMATATGNINDLEERVEDLEKGAGITPSSWQVSLSLEPIKITQTQQAISIDQIWEEIRKIEPILAAHGIAIKQLQPTGG
jgi:archaellum component FlaC